MSPLPRSATDRVAWVSDWLDLMERWLRKMRHGFAARDPQRNTRRLAWPHMVGVLGRAQRFYWEDRRFEPGRKDPGFRGKYRSLLETMKLVADDLFIEARAQAALEASTATARHTQQEVARKSYVEWLKEWIRASPAIERPPSDRLFYQSPPWKRLPPAAREEVAEVTAPLLALDAERLPAGIAKLAERAADELKRRIEMARQRATSGRAPFRLEPSPEWYHHVGVPFMLLQLWLPQLSEDSPMVAGPTKRILLNRWYPEASAVVRAMADLIDLPGVHEREALIGGRPDEVVELYRERQRLHQALAEVYGVRGEVTAALWTAILDPGERGAAEIGRAIWDPATARDEHRKPEIVTALSGAPEPDDEEAGGISVDALLDAPDGLLNQQVTVRGIFREPGVVADRFRLHSARSGRWIEVRSGQEMKDTGARFVVVDGTLKPGSTGGTYFLDARRVDERQPPYVSLVCPSISLAHAEMRGRPADDWRIPTEATAKFAAEELEFDRLGDSLIGQRGQATEHVYWQRIRAQLADTLGAGNLLALDDREIRTKVWRILLAEFLPEHPVDGMTRLLEELQRYLTHYTRHTFWNLRDHGQNYLDSAWPRDIAGKGLRDCGVYALEIAYDIFRAVQELPGAPAVEFRLLITKTHVTLFGAFGRHWFMANNDRIRPPQVLAAPGPATRDEAILWAAGAGHMTAFNDLTYSVVPFLRTRPITAGKELLPPGSSAGVSDAEFKEAIWRAFMTIVGGGRWSFLTPALAEAYHVLQRAFQHRSAALAGDLAKLKSTDPSSPEMLQATVAARQLFDLSEQLVNPKFFNPTLLPGGRGVVITPPRVANRSGDVSEAVPMFQVARALRQAQGRGRRLTGEQADLVARGASLEERLLRIWDGKIEVDLPEAGL